VTAALRLALSLLGSLLLWVPTLPGALAGGEDPAGIAVRYLVCLLAARLGVGILFRVVTGYAGDLDDAHAEGSDPSEADEPGEEPETLPYGRRRDDADEEALLAEALEDVEDTTALAS